MPCLQGRIHISPLLGSNSARNERLCEWLLAREDVTPDSGAAALRVAPLLMSERPLAICNNTEARHYDGAAL